ncbi:hypothetical protein E3N88_00091 [Mikania micrantha]|uniref:Uncharacterized protein n=1 Tax=Mikania micrantha TaxID=192012 RepID=A0A5N6PX32_9ASTR|nr:hypothetical protein E3N88_00091 [Mikania micrantha]
MMNVGENLAQKRVLDCPKSINEENFLSVDRMGSSRYAMEGLRILRGTRCLENILDSSGNLRGTRSLLWHLVAISPGNVFSSPDHRFNRRYSSD